MLKHFRSSCITISSSKTRSHDSPDYRGYRTVRTDDIHENLLHGH